MGGFRCFELIPILGDHPGLVVQEDPCEAVRPIPEREEVAEESVERDHRCGIGLFGERVSPTSWSEVSSPGFRGE